MRAIKRTIKARWLRNIFIVTVVILVVISGILAYSVYQRYNHAAQMTLKSCDTDVADTYFSYYYPLDSKTFSEAAANFVENYEYRDKIEIWVIDKSGNPLVSSGGYEIGEYTEMPDYYEALNSENKTAVKRCRTFWGEPVMAMSYILRDSSGENCGAVRYLVSLRDVNLQYYLIIGTIIAGVFLIAMLMFNSGYYFVSSIVNPVKVVNQTAKRIAKGDFSARISIPHTDDEIGELCDTINDMARQLGQMDEMKNSFISTVSHEIRTPLTAIKGWSETLSSSAEKSEDEVLKRGLEIITSETGRLSSMVEELLDFSRMQSGKLKMKNGVVDIIAEVQQAYLMYRPKAEKEGKTLRLVLPKNEESFVDGDSDRICQVFINILDNAVKYTETNGKIIIKVENLKKYVKISFIDNGCGISKSDLQHVKEKFYKANNEKHGTGIGLAVVDEIIKLHNGLFRIDSTENKGTTVEVMFPLHTA